MDIISKEKRILRRTLELHVQAFLDGKEPLYMSELTSTKYDSGKQTLRRYYETVSEWEPYSHVSYLGTRDLIIEITHIPEGRTYFNTVMEGNAPITKGLMRRARNFYERDPDISSRAIADLVMTEYSLSLCKQNYSRTLRGIKSRFKDWAHELNRHRLLSF